MKIDCHRIQKLFSIVLYYGWMGLMYGFLISFLLQEYSVDAPWLKAVIVSCITISTLWVAYFSEMRQHMPTKKYIIVVIIAFSGVIASAKFPLLIPLFFILFLVSILYRCADCVAFTRIKP